MGLGDEGCRRLLEACHLAWRLPGFRILLRGRFNPLRCGFRKTVGTPRPGKLCDAEATGFDCSRCHIVVYPDHVEAHRDRVSPLCNPLIHFIIDSWKHFAGLQSLVALAAAVLGYTWVSATSIASLALTLVLRALLGGALR